MRLMGTTCNLRWRSDPGGEHEVIWTVNPSHPIAVGVPQPIVIPHQEMYGEFFDIPPPDELVFISSFAGGEVFRGGGCFHRGPGRHFCFRPTHQEFPVVHHPPIPPVTANSAARIAPSAPAHAMPTTSPAKAPRKPY